MLYILSEQVHPSNSSPVLPTDMQYKGLFTEFSNPFRASLPRDAERTARSTQLTWPVSEGSCRCRPSQWVQFGSPACYWVGT